MSTLVEIEFNGVTLDEEAAASIQKEMQQELEILESGGPGGKAENLT